ncbi:MAG: hypothetical protein ACI4OX_03475 [Akkermansia sp.]
MNHIQFGRLIATFALALILISCETPIPMQEMVPAQISLPRGSRIAVSASGPVAAKMRYATQRVIGNDHFFNLVNGVADFRVHILTDRELRPGDYYAYHAKFLLLNAYNRSIIYSSKVVDVGYDFSYYYECISAAEDFYSKIHPYVKDYIVLVNIDKEKNPNLFLAAELCRTGKWNAGYEKVKESIAAVPNDPEAYFLRAMIERENFQYDESNASLQQALQIKPESKYTYAIKKNAQLRVSQEIVEKQMNNVR